MKEIWKDIKNYEGLYQISNLGRVKSLWYGREKILIPVKLKNGYLRVILCKNGILKTYYVHRLVAEAFLDNPNNLPQVNHKDENKQNNNVENLEWCTNEYNINYGTRTERCSKKVYQYTIDNILIKKWNSIAECERNGFKHSLIIYCCQGKRKTHKGFKWSYSLYSESKTNSD